MRVAQPSSMVGFSFEDQALLAPLGANLAASLFVAGIRLLRESPRLHQPRGMFCMLGSCQECLVMVDGRRTLACQTAITAGLRVQRVAKTGTDG
jgi:predicted molibdopterin-dependent oxidoreductase YjgC